MVVEVNELINAFPIFLKRSDLLTVDTLHF